MATHSEGSSYQASRRVKSSSKTSQMTENQEMQSNQHLSRDPKCFCNLETRLKISNSDRNPGRPYFNCPNFRSNGGCKFFVWQDETETTESKIVGGDEEMLEELKHMRHELGMLKVEL